MSIHDWPPTRVELPPPISSEWQRRLDQIGGFAPNGMSILKLEWGGTATWTRYTKDLKYLYARQEYQTGWRIPLLDNAGNVIKDLYFPLKSKNPPPPPSKNHGIAMPMMEAQEIGIPRWYITQYIHPSLVGNWAEARHAVLTDIGKFADMGERPNEGMYYLGFHGLWHHEGRQCCKNAVERRGKCFGYYREPTELDLLYVQSIYKEMQDTPQTHSWMEAADDRTMTRVLNDRLTKYAKDEEQDRAAMKLRIRDALKSHKARLTARKGQDTWIMTPYDKIMPGTTLSR